MTAGLERWAKRQGHTIVRCEEIPGGYAAMPYRVTLAAADGRVEEAVYKRFAPGRAQELTLYRDVLGGVPFGVPKLLGAVQEEGEQGILMEAAGDVLKPLYQGANERGKAGLLHKIICLLADLHVSMERQGAQWLEAGVLASYPFESSEQWAQEALGELRWLAEQNLLHREEAAGIEGMAAKFYPQYPGWVTGRHTFTHGDPHLGNVLRDGEQVRLIDWEWACVAVPQRDVAILLQDVLEDGLHAFAVDLYLQRMGEQGWAAEEAAFLQAFRACLFDNTLMMLGWEIGKFRNGNLARADLEQILAAKLHWMRRSFAELTQGEG